MRNWKVSGTALASPETGMPIGVSMLASLVAVALRTAPESDFPLKLRAETKYKPVTQVVLPEMDPLVINQFMLWSAAY